MSKHNHIHHLHQRAARFVQDTQPEEEPLEEPLVVSIVYVTASKTFDGPVGGYRTLNPLVGPQSAIPDNDTETQPSDAAELSSSVIETDPSPISTTSFTLKPISTAESHSELKSVSLVSAKTTSKASAQTSFQASKPAVTESHSLSVARPSQEHPSSTVTLVEPATASNAASTASTLTSASQTQGLSSGAKAGLAVGVILLIGLLGLVLLCLRRVKNKKKSYQKADDEKTAIENQRAPMRTQSFHSTRTTATAPRLSLRPVTQFLPDLGARRKSGNLSGTSGGPSQNALGSQEQMSEKDPSQVQPGSPTNPFSSNSEISQSTLIPAYANQSANPFENHADSHESSTLGALSPVQAPAPLRIRTPTPETTNAANVIPSSIAGGARDDRFRAPNQLNVSPSRPISPAGTEYSMSSVSTGYMAHGPPPSNVYRVQLDFNPSMDDELHLQAGQLIRLLHEYDDGWALCIRLDRSQQGVAPRTCLSSRPVKPRPAGNNRGPPPRGPPPYGMVGPGQNRPFSPAGNTGGRGLSSPYDREQGPMFHPARQGARSMSPGPYGGGPQHSHIPPPDARRRSNSVGQVRDRRNSPPGPSPMNPIASNMQRMHMPVQLQAGVAAGEFPYTQRKPVPGQAI